MSSGICFFVNSIFKTLFNESREIFNEVEFSELVCARSDKFQGQIEFLIAEEEKLSEAEIVARRIIKLKSENPERLPDWSDIAVLVRKRASFSELQKEFIKYRIPFIIVGGTGFYQQQSISDIYNYFAFLLNDKDDGALIGILRSPFFNISDTNIFELSLFEGKNYWEKLQVAFNLKHELWGHPFKILNENKNIAKRTNISYLLRKILQESNFISAISSRVNGVQELSNLNKLISFTNDFFNEEFNTLYDYVSFLSNAISKSEDEAQAGIDLGSNGVNILTIHQAKGLEYPAVFLYKCNDYTRVDKVKAGSFTVDKNFGLLTKVPLNENYFGKYESAPIVGIYNLIESRKDLAELKRLLYVGLTRAEDFLFITLTNTGESFKGNSFAGLITDALELDISLNSIELNGNLTYLKYEKDFYSNKTEKVHLEVPIIRNIENVSAESDTKPAEIPKQNFILSEIIDHSKGEVISATRYSTFSDCPVKYNLLYNYKVGELFSQSIHKTSRSTEELYDDYNRNELYSHLLDDKSKQNDYSKAVGKLIHYVLRKNISKQDLTNIIKNQIKYFFSGKNTDQLEREIISELDLFYNSEEYNYINSFKDYKNEFEVYLKEKDFYLFGILDKLIISDNKLIIVDYKTDNVIKEEINERAHKYLPQIQFYSYIVSRLFKNKKEVEGRIIFIKHPDAPFVFQYDALSDNNIKSGLKMMINSIRNNNYSVNLSACKSCFFSDDKSVCINLSY
jgi:ATP-dependent helicase/nuclease subunit A